MAEKPKGVQIPTEAHTLLATLRERLGRSNGLVIYRALVLLDRETANEKHASPDEWVKS